MNTKTGKVVYRDWAEIGKGTRMTSEFAGFLNRAAGRESVGSSQNSAWTIGRFYGVSGKHLLRQYRDFQGGFLAESSSGYSEIIEAIIAGER